MEVIFIGVGGTRKVLARQYPPFYTGGFRVHTENFKVHIDPGPGAITRSAQLGIMVEDTDLLVVTHNHIDHISDANAIGEAMNGFGFKKRGYLVCSKESVENEGCMNNITPYVTSMFREVATPKAGEELSFEFNGKMLKLKTTAVKHSDESGWGVLLEYEGKKIGYTSDTTWFDGLGKQFGKADLLIANIPRIGKSRWKKVHLSIREDLERLLDEAKPRKLVIYHIGEEIIHYGKERLEKELNEHYEGKFGCTLIIPKSGDRIKP